MQKRAFESGFFLEKLVKIVLKNSKQDTLKNSVKMYSNTVKMRSNLTEFLKKYVF